MKDDVRVGLVGCKLLNPDGSVQEAGGIIYSTGWGDPFGAGDDPARGCYNYTRDVDVVTGACFMVRRGLFDRLGGFDSRYNPAFYEEFDLATSIRNAGYRIVYQPASEVYHHGSASYGIEVRDRQTLKNHAVFCKKWATLLANQPAPGGSSFLSRERPSPRGTILVIDDKVPEYDKHRRSRHAVSVSRSFPGTGPSRSLCPARRRTAATLHQRAAASWHRGAASPRHALRLDQKRTAASLISSGPRGRT